MQNLGINLLIAALMVAGIAGLVWAQKNSQPAAVVQSSATSTPAGPLAQVASHNTRESCWTAINGEVYDLTSWIPKHPGGEDAILQLCGADGSAKFNGQHGGAATQASILAGFKVDGSEAVVPETATQPADDDSGRNRGRGSDDDSY